MTVSDKMTMARVLRSTPSVLNPARVVGLALLIVAVLVLAVVAFVIAPELYPLTVDPQADAAAGASAHGPTEVSALSAADRYWAAQLVRHRLAAVRSGRLTQPSRAADMGNWEAIERGGRP